MIGIVTMGRACTTRERNDAGASGPRPSSRNEQPTGAGGGTVPAATPFPTRGGGSRGAAVACGRRATARRPACNGRDAARVEGRLSRCTCHSRGREPWRDRCQRSTAASSRCERATGVTRRGRAGGSRDARATRGGGEGGRGRVERVREERVQRIGACRSRPAVA